MKKPVLFIKSHVDAFTRSDGVVVAAHDTKVQAAYVPDDENPKYALSGLSSHALGHAARGSIDLKNHAHDELANRGLDSDGKWVGFKQAAAHHAPLKNPPADDGAVPDKKATREVSDHMQGVHTSILSGAAHGKVDLTHQAKDQLAGRGHDSNGAWVGFDNAKKHHFGDASGKTKPKAATSAKPAKATLDGSPSEHATAHEGHTRLAQHMIGLENDGFRNTKTTALPDGGQAREWAHKDGRSAVTKVEKSAGGYTSSATTTAKPKPKAKPALDPHPNVIGKAENGKDHHFDFGGKTYHHTGKDGHSLHDQTPVKEAESEDGHRVWRDGADRVHADSREEARKIRGGK